MNKKRSINTDRKTEGEGGKERREQRQTETYKQTEGQIERRERSVRGGTQVGKLTVRMRTPDRLYRRETVTDRHDKHRHV